jgi:hypothetical protein
MICERRLPLPVADRSSFLSGSSSGASSPGASGPPCGGDDQELLVRLVPVERERGLTGRQLVDARAEQLPAQRAPQPPSRPPCSQVARAARLSRR